MSKLTNLSDLWKQCCDGNQQAYATLHYQLYPGIYNYLYRITKDDWLTDDLLQDLFTKLWLKRNSISKPDNVKAYFYTTARSIFINHIRQVKSQQLKLAQLLLPDMEFSAEDILTTEEQNIELKKLFAIALNKLPARQREIIYLKYYEEMDYDDIAALTGIRYQSVVNHVYRALQTLRAGFQLQGRKKLVA